MYRIFIFLKTIAAHSVSIPFLVRLAFIPIWFQAAFGNETRGQQVPTLRLFT